MSDNKLVKTVIDAATITGLAAGIGWIAKKTVKENFTADPSSNVMNYVKFTAVVAGSIALKQYLEDQKSSHLLKIFIYNGQYCDHGGWSCAQCRNIHWRQLSRTLSIGG